MGTINNKFFTDLAEKATWSAGVAFKRSNPLPIDRYSVFESIALANEYATTSAVAYPGQVIAAWDSDNNAMQVYVLSEVANEIENGEEQTYSLTLQELGGKVNADDLSINYNSDGLLEITGFKTADGLTLPQKQNDGTIKWVGIDAIVEGDGNTTYKFTLNTNKTGFTVTPVDAGVEGTPVDINFDVYTKSEIDAAIKVESDRALAAESALSTEIAKKADIIYVDDEIAGLESAISKLNHFTTKVISSISEVTEEGILYLIKDENATGIDKYNEYLFINGEATLIGDTTTDLSNYYNKSEIDTKTKSLDDRILTLEEVDNATQAELDAYKEEVNTALNNKATKATTLSGYGITDAYTTTQIDALLEGIQSGSSESAATVNAKLEQYKTSNDARVNTIETKLDTVETNAEKNIIEIIKANGSALSVDSTDRSVNITAGDLNAYTKTEVDNKVSAVSDVANAAKVSAETNASNIKALQETTISNLKSNVDTNTENIASIQTTLSGQSGTISTLEAAVSTKAESSTVNSLAERIGVNEGNITSLTTRVSANETSIGEINSTLLDKANKSEVYDKSQIDSITGTIPEGKTLVSMINDASYDDTQIKADIKANADAIALLNSDDKTQGSVDYKVAQEVAKILNDNDSSDIDTLEEIAAWITNDTTGAAKMNADIVKNTEAINKLNGTVDTEGSVLAMIAANAPKIATTEIAGLVKASSKENSISVATDGTMEVNSINVNKLVQTTGDTLILNGGSADV